MLRKLVMVVAVVLSGILAGVIVGELPAHAQGFNNFSSGFDCTEGAGTQICFQIQGFSTTVLDWKGSVRNDGFTFPVVYYFQISGPNGFHTDAIQIGPVKKGQTYPFTYDGLGGYHAPGRYCIAYWTDFAWIGGLCESIIK